MPLNKQWEIDYMKNLAAAFSVLARDSTVLESKAENVLKILKQRRSRT
jgi:hypothetical protein